MTAEHEQLFARIEAAIGKAKPSTVAMWRHCAVRFGIESGAAKGALLEAVREIWDDPYIVAEVNTGWSFGVSRWPEEIDALVCMLEEAP